MSNVYYLSFRRPNVDTAANKAPKDIEKICSDKGFIKFEIDPFPVDKNKLYQKYWLFTYCRGWWKKLYDMVQPGDTVIYQHPMYGIRVAIEYIKKIKKDKNCKFIALIHDLPTLRGQVLENENRGAGNTTKTMGDTALLQLFDAVICHNERMNKVLTDYGIDKEKLINLEIFDYLLDEDREFKERKFTRSVTVAGNMSVLKSGYIYKIKDDSHNSGLQLHLYGPNLSEEKKTDNMIWHGSVDPAELPFLLEGSFGIVWDGDSAETCSGKNGNYLRYNNPHKTSLYLLSEMPVIIWKEAAMADFVIKNGAGIAVNSLYEVEDAIKGISEEEYNSMCRNAVKISEKLRSGFYFSEALKKAFEVIRK